MFTVFFFSGKETSSSNQSEGNMKRFPILMGAAAMLLAYCSWSLAQLSGSYDVGGGNNNYATPVAAAAALQAQGVSGPVTFNIYNGSYNGQVNLPAIAGVSATNTVTFHNATGQNPVITSTTGHGFYLSGADHITIQGLEVTNCAFNGIYNCSSGLNSSSFNRFIRNYIHNNGSYGANYSGIYLNEAEDCQVLQNEITGCWYGIEYGNGARNIIANNMIYNNEYCIYGNFGTNYAFYYNSVYTITFQAFRIYATTNTTVKDNIFYQAGSGWVHALFLCDGFEISTIVSDYNDLYAPNGNVGYYNGDRPTLSNWQGYTGLDAHSISANPNFVSPYTPYDLHINLPSPVDSAGIPIVGITIDYDGNLRNPIHPDIGADEVGVAGPPGVVDDLTITLSSSTDDSTNITLSWSPALNAQQYHIYKSTTSPESGFVLIGSIINTICTDSNAIVGQTKSFYYVTADNGSLYSPETGIQPPTGIGTPAAERNFSGLYSNP